MLTRAEVLKLILSKLPDGLDPKIEEKTIDKALNFIERDGDFDIKIEEKDLGEYIIDNPLAGLVGQEDGHWEPRIEFQLDIISKTKD